MSINPLIAGSVVIAALASAPEIDGAEPTGRVGRGSECARPCDRRVGRPAHQGDERLSWLGQ